MLEHRTGRHGRFMSKVSRLRRLAFPFGAWVAAGGDRLVARKQEMDARFSGDAGCHDPGRSCWSWHQNRHRPRPSVGENRTCRGPDRSLSSKYHAFPSGHVAASTAFFAVLLFANRRIGILCLPIPLLIGFARMYIDAHYLSDVVCAALLGFLMRGGVVAFSLESAIHGPQSAIESGGGGGIRTHEGLRPSGFQDRRDQPLCHPSGQTRVMATHYSITPTLQAEFVRAIREDGVPEYWSGDVLDF